MGLDFTIYAKNKDENVEDVELAYGRKSWELVHFLNLNSNEFDVPVKREDWDRLIEAMKPIANKFEDIAEAFHKWAYSDDIDFSEFVFTDEDKKLIAEYEFWHTVNFDEAPTLDYEFSVSYMKNFWDARDEVNYYFCHPESWEVRAEISY
jgi:hypothetical protein